MIPSGARHSYGLLVDVSAHEVVAGASRHPSQRGVVMSLALLIADAVRRGWAAVARSRS
ncbi:MAG: hypothetical protein JSR59_13445 [Proteobacteria bacterium]|nr:hypothetical protein [Pseudomonadota bacterium]